MAVKTQVMSFLIKKEKKTQMFPPILQYYFIIKQIGATNIITSIMRSVWCSSYLHLSHDSQNDKMQTT